jgi:DnaJ homolog subfamily A member 2
MGVTLEEIYTGKKVRLIVKRDRICNRCEGKGGKAGTVRSCLTCKGHGTICKNSESYDTCEGETSEDETCNICEGFGEVIDGQYLCEDC